jgi:hypothetical protein
MKRTFINLFLKAQKLGKAKQLIKFLDTKYSIWITDNPDISKEELKDEVYFADWSLISKKEMEEIAILASAKLF